MIWKSYNKIERGISWHCFTDLLFFANAVLSLAETGIYADTAELKFESFPNFFTDQEP